MNILFICDEYPPGKSGGIGTAVQNISRALVKKGHLVSVVGLYEYSYGGKKIESDEGVKVWRFRYGPNFGTKNKLPYRIFSKLPNFIKACINFYPYLTFINFIKKQIVNEKIDIIEVPDYSTYVFNLGFIPKWPHLSVPLVLKSHGSYTYFASELNVTPKKKWRRMDALLFERADGLSAVSAYTALKNKKLFNISRDVKVLYNCIDVFSGNIEKEIPRQEATVIYTGTLSEKKGVFQLIKAWNRVRLLNPNAELKIFGKGDATRVQELLDKNAKGSVQLMGHVDRTVLFEHLKSATMAVFPSYSECFALAPMEAMASGCPVIYTKRASGEELITEGENGLLVDPDDLNELTEKMHRLLHDVSLQKRLSENGYRRIRNDFNLDQSAEDHIKFYRQTINRFTKNI